MRKKIHPLSVHLGMAAANMEGVEAFTKSCGDSISKENAVKMVRGIQLYQQSNLDNVKLNNKIIWEGAGAKLLRPELKGETKGRALILVPSLINKAHIFDLSEQDSILRWLHKNDINAYLFDWGTLNNDQTIEQLMQNRLNPALVHAANETEENEIDVLGYCMGGTLILSHHEMITAQIRNIIALATPWNFKAEGAKLSQQVRIWAPMALTMIEKRKKLPAEWVQALFASIDPKGASRKFIAFADMEHNEAKAQKFIKVEDWLNDGVDIPKEIAHQCIQSWFKENSLYQKKVDIKRTNILIVASERDKLVPFESAKALTHSVPHNQVSIKKVSSGHIGLIAGANAQQDVWQPIKDWLLSN